MLYGMAGEQAELFRDAGHRVRIYTPFGEPIPGMAYLVRRLLENSSNDSFVRHAHDPAADPAALFMNPVTAGDAEPPEELETNPPHGGFANEPLTDFAIAENRDAMHAALEQVEGELGGEYSLVIDGRSVQPNLNLVSRDPADGVTVIGKVPAATPRDADAAVAAAKKAFPAWMRTGAAAPLRVPRTRRRGPAAPPVRTGRLDGAGGRQDLGGGGRRRRRGDRLPAATTPSRCETSPTAASWTCRASTTCFRYRPRGVAVVIAPWNFPLAILTGMTAAALVTGNTVVMKPAEQSPVIAALLMDVLRDAGVPDGVVNYLPGDGELIGPPLVSPPGRGPRRLHRQPRGRPEHQRRGRQDPARAGPRQNRPRGDGREERDHRRRRRRPRRSRPRRAAQRLRLRRPEVQRVQPGDRRWRTPTTSSSPASREPSKA